MMKRGMPPLMLEKRTKNKRGVSPIIATILLVAITVVIAAVLYVLVSGYLSGTGSAPKTIQLAQPSAETKTGGASGCAGGTTDWVVSFSSISASSGLTTGSVGFKVVNTAGASVGLVSACVFSAVGSVVDTYTGSTATWQNSTVVFPSGGSIYFNLGTTQLTSSGDTIQAFGLGGASVSGGYSGGL